MDEPPIHHRRSIRMPGYDYSQAAAYFVTLVTAKRECLFGAIVHDEMQLSDLGTIVREEWEQSASIRREIELDTFVVMPNHLHGIIWIVDDEAHGAHDAAAHGNGAHGRAPLPTPHDRPPLSRPPRSLGSFVAGFKSAATARVNQLRNTPHVPVWQRNYYEHIVRNDASLATLRQYIIDNARQWGLDAENPYRS